MVGSHTSWCDLQAELGGVLSDEPDLLLAVSLLVVFRPFVDVLLTILQHAIDQSGEAVRHGGDGFRSVEPGTQASVLRAETGLASLVRSRLPAAVRWLRG
jgi:hypothetical protein